MTHLMEKGGNEEQGKKGRKRNTEAKARRTVLKKDDQIEEGIRARARARERERERERERDAKDGRELWLRARYTSLVAALIRDDLSPTHGWP